MKKIVFTFLFALSSVGFAADWKTQQSLRPLIVGGVPAEKGEFPFMASIHTRYYGHTCGGSLVAPNWVLTAGHCVGASLEITKVYVGLYKQAEKGEAEEFTISKIVRHPLYANSNDGADYDFALLKLDHDSTRAPIILNREEKSIPKDGSSTLMVTTAGWGLLKENSHTVPDILQKVEVPLVHQDICNQSYSDHISERMICAGYSEGGKDSCQGDSGGPLFQTNADHSFSLVGIVSWGEGCARPNKYGVYSKVNSVIDWVDAEMAKE